MRYLTAGILFFVSIFLFGCSPADQLKGQLEKNVCSLQYIHDSEQVSEKLPTTIFVENTVVEQDLPPEMVVALEESDFMYLVLAAWKSEEFSCKLGKTVLEEDPASFITASMKKELQRSGYFCLTDTKSDADFVLETKLVKCGCQLTYKQSVSAAGYSSFHETSASPSVSAVDIAMVFTEGEIVLIDESVNSVITSPYPQSGPDSGYEVSRNCVENMAESFSLAIKDCVEQIVNRINEERKPKKSDIVAYSLTTE